MHWLGHGNAIVDYPGWSRVVIVADRQRHTWLKERYWGRLEDFDHRVYTLHEIQTGHFPSRYTMYRFDDLDAVLYQCFPNLNIDGFTITADKWDQTVINNEGR